MGAAIMVRVLNTGLSLYPPPFYVPEYYFHDLLAPPSPMFCSFGTSRSPRSTDNAAHTRDADTQTDSLLVCSGGVYRARPFHPPPTAYSSLTVGDCLPAQYPHRYFNGRHAPTTVPHSRRAIFPCGVASTLPPQPHPLSLRQNRAPLRPSSSPLTGLPLGCDGCDVSSDPTSHRLQAAVLPSTRRPTHPAAVPIRATEEPTLGPWAAGHPWTSPCALLPSYGAASNHSYPCSPLSPSALPSGRFPNGLLDGSALVRSDRVWVQRPSAPLLQLPSHSGSSLPLSPKPSV
eukprot:GGOE01029482.1.p1 GENE.GGOE01029482.1~~GGOE01029482.1.p1  ORF type:complete len:319 (+),score=-10.55 GGOE01029482.1:95-958(+)